MKYKTENKNKIQSVKSTKTKVVDNDNLISVLQNLPVGVIIHHNSICLFANKEACDMLEEDNCEALLGKNIIPYFDKNQQNFALSRIKEILKGNNFDYRVYSLITNKKNKINVLLKSNQIQFNNTLCVQTIITNLINDTIIYENSVKTQIIEQANKALQNEIFHRNIIEKKLLTQTRKLESIFENSSHLIWTVDKDFKLITCNNNFIKTFKKNYGVWPILNKQLHTLLNADEQKKYKNYWYNLYNKALKGNSLKFERIDSDKTNEIYFNPIRNETNEIVEIACLAHDISENKIFEKQLLEQSAKLNTIFNTSTHIIWTVDINYNLSSFNQNYFNQLSSFYKRKIIKGINFKELYKKILSTDDFNNWMAKFALAFKGENVLFETEKSVPNGNTIYREIYLNPTFNTEGKVVEVVAISHNITERKLNEIEVKKQSAKLQAIFESGDQLMWTINKNKEITSFNKNYANSFFELYNYYPVIGKTTRSDKTTKFHSMWDEKYELAFSGKQIEFISERETLKGKKIIRQIILNPIKDANNNVLEVSGIGFDITENKINEEKITQSLKEKEVLLKEVHHRVKNNMQVITSILNLQSSYVKDQYAHDLLKECQNRIKSMAFIHESLYQTKNFEMVNFSEYLSTLTRNLVHTYAINTRQIKLVLNIKELFLNLDLSIPCGLIINELISNSLKYAFPNKKGGVIFVNLKTNNNKIKLEIGDNGIGISKKIDINNSPTLGLQLVNTLIEQINGKLKLDLTTGTKFSIEFKTQ